MTYMAIIRVIKTKNNKPMRIALPNDEVITLRKEDILTIPLPFASLLSKYGYVEIFQIYEEMKHDILGEHRAENMANVEE